MFANLATGECVWDPPVGVQVYGVRLYALCIDTLISYMSTYGDCLALHW